MNNDPIADYLTRIRNASLAGLPAVEMPSSSLKVEITKLLQREGYIRSFELKDSGRQSYKTLRLMLKYDDQGYPVIRKLKRVSRPGLRKYSKVDELQRVLGGSGVAVVTTNRGLKSDRECRRDRVSGEILFYVY
jgi:small subunit ribosomal protein S8